MATLEEQETIINQNRSADHVSVWTSNTHDIEYFSKRPEFVLQREWRDEDGIVEAAEFHLPKDRANIRKIVKTQRGPLSEERKASLHAGRERARNSE